MSKFDLLLKKAASFEKLALYSDRKAFLQAVAQQYSDPNASVDPTAFSNKEVEQWDSQKTPQGIPAPPPDAGSPITPPPAMNAPAPREQAKAPAVAQVSVTPDDQKMISDFLVKYNMGIPLSKTDGKYGPETAQAINNIRKNVKSLAGMGDAQVIETLRGWSSMQQQYPQTDEQKWQQMLKRRT